MKIAIFVPFQFAATGCRFLASYVRQNGHEAKLIFVPDLVPSMENSRYARNVRYECSERLLECCVDLVEDCEIVGFSVLAAFHEASSQISHYVKEKTGKPTIWGGVHPTQHPKPCLEFSDFICVGDGEDTLIELMNALESGGDITKIAGLWIKDGNQNIKTTPREMRSDLDSFPFPDFSFEDTWWIDSTKGAERAISVTPELYAAEQKKYPDHTGQHVLLPYKTVTTRGCPFFCSYCAMGTLDKNESPFRKRTVENVIRELETVVKEHGDMIELISLADDTFLSHSRGWIEEFSTAYKDRVGLPLRVIGFPESVSEDKISNLCEAGAMHFGMGVESLSEKTLDLYDRHTKPKRVVKAANTIVDYSSRYNLLPPTFDVILGNPYEEQKEVLTTYRRILEIENPSEFILYHLCFFPGSKLYNKAVEDGIVKTEGKLVFRSWYSNDELIDPFMNFLFKAKTDGNVGCWPLKLISNEAIFNFLSKLYERSWLVRQFLAALIFDPKGFLSGKYVYKALRKLVFDPKGLLAGKYVYKTQRVQKNAGQEVSSASPASGPTPVSTTSSVSLLQVGRRL